MSDLAVVYDLDGTLVDTVQGIKSSLVEIIFEETRDWVEFSDEQVRSFIGRGVPNLVASALNSTGHLVQNTSELVEQFETALERNQVEGSKLYPGVMSALSRIQSMGYKQAVCTNKSRRATIKLLNSIGISHLFGAIVCGDDPGRGKPFADPVFLCEELLMSDTCVYVGDSETDEETAKKAGRPFFLHVNGYRQKELNDFECIHAFSDFLELPALLTQSDM